MGILQDAISAFSSPQFFSTSNGQNLQGLPFVTIYLDDIFVHSPSETSHKEHLDVIFNHLLDAGLTLRGSNAT